MCFKNMSISGLTPDPRELIIFFVEHLFGKLVGNVFIAFWHTYYSDSPTLAESSSAVFNLVYSIHTNLHSFEETQFTISMKVNGLTKVNVIGCYACAIEAVKPRSSTAEKELSTSSSFCSSCSWFKADMDREDASGSTTQSSAVREKELETMVQALVEKALASERARLPGEHARI